MTPIRIQIVEDEIIVAEDLRLTLQSLGHAVVALSPSGQQAVQDALIQRPDVVLMDIQLGPGMDGIEAAKRISAGTGAPVVFVTANSDADIMDRVVRSGGAAYILKPFDPRELGITVRMVVEKHEIEQRLRESEARYRSLFTRLPVGLYMASAEGLILDANPAMARLLGLPDVDAVRRLKAQDFWVHPEEREGFLAELRVSGMVLDFEFEAVRADQQTCWFQATARATQAADGSIERYEAFISDISERRQIEERRKDQTYRFLQQQQDRSTLTLAGGIAHEFNNALTVVLGNLELLRMRVPGESEQGFMDHIVRAGESMATLTRQLLGYAMGGKYVSRMQSVPSLIGRAIEQAGRGRITPGIQIYSNVESDIWPILADDEQIIQVLTSLLINALESMEKRSGAVRVQVSNAERPQNWVCRRKRTHSAGDYVRILISDNGPGIPPEFQDRIFEPFFTTKFMGRGLGLSAASGIVRNHGGCICLEESGPTTGTTFTLLLPRAPRGEEVSAMPRISDQDASAGLVLIADDDPAVLGIMTDILTTHRFTVAKAPGGIEAVRLFLERPGEFSLAILDVIMDDRNGRQVYLDLKAVRPGLPILMTSGYDETTAIPQMELGEIDGFLGKPFSRAALVRKVESLLQAAARAR